MNSMTQSPVRDHLNNIPSCEEVQSTIDHLKSQSCRRVWYTCILPELLKCSGSVIVEKPVELFDSVWRDKCVVKDCKAVTSSLVALVLAGSFFSQTL